MFFPMNRSNVLFAIVLVEEGFSTDMADIRFWDLRDAGYGTKLFTVA